MPKITPISGDKAVRIFQKMGYKVVRQRGSHIRMHHLFDKSKKPLTIPRHPILGKGLLRRLMRDAKINPEELKKLL